MTKLYSTRFWATFILVALTLIMGGCASTSNSAKNPDPYENLNRKIFAFNDGVDHYVLRPTAKGYKKITPDPVEKSVTNFFSNINELRNSTNSLLQGKLGKAGNSAGRFLVNSTFGLAGLFDVAGKAGLTKNQPEDFGQTLNTWGIAEGPFLMLPFLGPSTGSALAGRGVDWFQDPVNYLDDEKLDLTLKGIEVINLRASLLEADKLVAGDRYLFIRDTYLQQREFLINDGASPAELGDSFGDDFGSDFSDGFSDDFGVEFEAEQSEVSDESGDAILDETSTDPFE